ncbi:MAG: hypothetical protein ABR924_17435, partial [Terracidiphilus sp.]
MLGFRDGPFRQLINNLHHNNPTAQVVSIESIEQVHQRGQQANISTPGQSHNRFAEGFAFCLMEPSRQGIANG